MFPLAKNRMKKQVVAVQAKKENKETRTEAVSSVLFSFPIAFFHNRIVETLRDAHRGMTLEDIGSIITLDWADEHQSWCWKG